MMLMMSSFFLSFMSKLTPIWYFPSSVSLTVTGTLATGSFMLFRKGKLSPKSNSISAGTREMDHGFSTIEFLTEIKTCSSCSVLSAASTRRT